MCICLEVHDDLFLPKQTSSYVFFKNHANLFFYDLLVEEVTLNGCIRHFFVTINLFSLNNGKAFLLSQ